MKLTVCYIQSYDNLCFELQEIWLRNNRDIAFQSLTVGLLSLVLLGSREYRLNRLDEPVFMAVPKPLLTEFAIHHRLESCGDVCFMTCCALMGSDHFEYTLLLIPFFLL